MSVTFFIELLIHVRHVGCMKKEAQVNYLDLIDNSLEADFNKPVYDPAKGRNRAIGVIDKAAKQHGEGKTPAIRAWKLGNNNAISFTLALDGQAISINKRETNFIPAERFQDFLKSLKAEVAAGKLDKEIEAVLSSSAKSGNAAKPSSGKAKDKFPVEQCSYYSTLDNGARKSVGSLWNKGKNPDHSLRAEVGDKPNAPYAGSAKPKKK
ncbi:hypothetical protein MRBLMC3_000160 [Sphingobium sp. LMC3-1-1.1]|uniref:hypothetical protein n=1 Tax=Sphingobium sp. LMC3-1-1.1 TaxID=3135241 RepID=UPI003448D341